MELEKQNILFFSRTMEMGGTSNVMIQLCQILKPFVNKIVVCSRGGNMVNILEQMEIKHIEIGDVGKHTPFEMFKILRQVGRILRDENITVVHTHHRMAAFYTAVLQKFNKFVFVNTAHNTFYNHKVMTRFAYKKAHLIACGEMVKKNLTNYYGLPDNQVIVIRNAVQAFDEDIVAVEKLTKLRDEGYFLVGNVGRFAEQKGMEYFIASLPIVKKEYPLVKYILIGDGQDRGKLVRQVENLGLDNDVVFLGYRKDVQNVIAQLDLLVLSSLWEGLPLTLIEAFSVGKTVVATDVDGNVEIVADEKNGCLIPPKAPEAIAEKVLELIKHPEKRRKFEDNAKITFIKEFSFERFSEKVSRYYKQL